MPKGDRGDFGSLSPSIDNEQDMARFYRAVMGVMPFPPSQNIDDRRNDRSIDPVDLNFYGPDPQTIFAHAQPRQGPYDADIVNSLERASRDWAIEMMGRRPLQNFGVKPPAPIEAQFPSFNDPRRMR